MRITSESFEDGGPIPKRCAFGKHDPETHVTFCENRNPQIAWAELPLGTKSLALIAVDVDVPSKPDDVNQEGREVPADLPRVDFYHWVLVDLDPAAGAIAEGAHSQGVVPKGKSKEDAPAGCRHGRNDYTSWFSGNPDMSGTYFGYDGPGPPWNDSILHHYHFRLYALDVDRCPVDGELDGAKVLSAIEGHVLGEASIVGTYAINPNVAR